MGLFKTLFFLNSSKDFGSFFKGPLEPNIEWDFLSNCGNKVNLKPVTLIIIADVFGWGGKKSLLFLKTFLFYSKCAQYQWYCCLLPFWKITWQYMFKNFEKIHTTCSRINTVLTWVGPSWCKAFIHLSLWSLQRKSLNVQ